MKSLLFALIAIGLVLLPCLVGFCATEERVVNLPNDQAKWYVSVVGDKDDVGFQRVLYWFSANEKLAGLKEQCHFCQVTKDGPMFFERYARNQGRYEITDYPCVRVQKANGVVIFQACGDAIPTTASGLYNEIASAVQKHKSPAEGCCPFRRRTPEPEPQPEPEPVIPDPEPMPIDDGGAPIVEPEPSGPSDVLVIVLTVLGAVGGAGAGLIGQLKRTYSK